MNTKLKMMACAVAAALTAGGPTAAWALTTNFDDLAPATSFGIGQVIASHGFSFTVTAYPSGSGVAAVSNNRAGGGGTELWMPSGAGVQWGLPANAQFAMFRYAEFHPQNGMTINGSTLPVGTSISQANGLTVGGVKIAVMQASTTPGGDNGMVYLAGPIGSLVVGGVEFAMDDPVALAVEPNPNFNGDGAMDGKDFLVWQQNVGKTGQVWTYEGDTEPDQDVDAMDFEVWKFKFGWTPTSPPWVGAVPEPATCWLAAAGGAGLLLRRRRAA